MFEQDPKFEQGIERARILYDEGFEAVADYWIAATMAMMGRMPADHPDIAKATMQRAIDKFPNGKVGKRP